jgi:hypothetical protein
MPRVEVNKAGDLRVTCWSCGNLNLVRGRREGKTAREWLEAGNHLTVECGHCDKHTTVALPRPEGEPRKAGVLEVGKDGSVAITCPGCGARVTSTDNRATDILLAGVGIAVRCPRCGWQGDFQPVAHAAPDGTDYQEIDNPGLAEADRTAARAACESVAEQMARQMVTRSVADQLLQLGASRN